jgi:predicted anti-sigma-YlaC factor YlaD
MSAARPLFALLLFAASSFCAGCSPRAYVIGQVADAVSDPGGAFSRDDDPELVREAAPFGLKTMESLLEADPNHRGLLAALARGFTEYSAAYVAQDAIEASDPAAKAAGLSRARRLYARARDYGLRGLSAARPGFRAQLDADPAGAVASFGREDVPLLFWTGVSWTLLVSSSQDDPSTLADLPKCEAIMRRALALDETFDKGAIHEFFIAFEGGRSEAMGGSIERANRHYDRAMQLSGGKRVSPMVRLAESVAVRTQDRKLFTNLVDRALAYDALAESPENRLGNLIAQRKARYLKGRTDDLFLE